MYAFVTTRMAMSMEKLTKFFKKCYDSFIAITGYVVLACDKVKDLATRLKDFTVDLVKIVVTHFNKKKKSRGLLTLCFFKCFMIIINKSIYRLKSF